MSRWLDWTSWDNLGASRIWIKLAYIQTKYKQCQDGWIERVKKSLQVSRISTEPTEMQNKSFQALDCSQSQVYDLNNQEMWGMLELSLYNDWWCFFCKGQLVWDS